MNLWIRTGYCPHGMPHFTYGRYNGYAIAYRFIICEDHGAACRGLSKKKAKKGKRR